MFRHLTVNGIYDFSVQSAFLRGGQAVVRNGCPTGKARGLLFARPCDRHGINGKIPNTWLPICGVVCNMGSVQLRTLKPSLMKILTIALRGILYSGLAAILAVAWRGIQTATAQDQTLQLVGSWPGFKGINRGNAAGVAVSGNYAYVAHARAGLQVIDISDFAEPAADDGGGTIFQITDITRSTVEISITWNSRDGREYSVEFRESVAEGVWIELDDGILSEGESTSFTDDDPGRAARRLLPGTRELTGLYMGRTHQRHLMCLEVRPSSGPSNHANNAPIITRIIPQIRRMIP
jgi:hypothetical protein